jgi:hypothetical protein
MNPADSLKCDTSVITRFRESGNFDYFSQKLKPQLDEASDAMDIQQDPGLLDSTLAKVIMILILACIIAIIIYMMYKNGMFSRNKKLEEDEEDEEEEENGLNIEGIDFDHEILSAEQSGEWNKAVRLIYLQSLKQLSDDGRVVWEKHKTPTEYSIEAGSEPFRWMTNQFLYTRYGEFQADESSCHEMHQRQEEMMKGGEHEE